MKVGLQNCLYVHLVYLPYLNASKEFKSKPAQNSFREIRGLGISPNVLVARSETPAPDSIKAKLSLYCGVPEEAIALLPNADSIYQVPLTIEDSGLTDVIVDRLHIEIKPPLGHLNSWRKTVAMATENHPHTVKIGVIAKYMDNQDTYMSVFEALRSAAWSNDANITIDWIDAEALGKLTKPESVTKKLSAYDGIVVPGGFGTRGVDGKIVAAQYALKNKLPYLGLCYGLHMAVIAAARNAGLADAHTTEVDPDTKHAVIDTMEGQKGMENTGGTMRLGNYNCQLEAGSLAARVYGAKKIVERHRHRYECQAKYQPKYASWGIRASGINPDNKLVEVIEADSSIGHPFFLASQFHPELKSRPTRPHPMFAGFVEAILAHRQS